MAKTKRKGPLPADTRPRATRRISIPPGHPEIAAATLVHIPGSRSFYAGNGIETLGPGNTPGRNTYWRTCTRSPTTGTCSNRFPAYPGEAASTSHILKSRHGATGRTGHAVNTNKPEGINYNSVP